MALASIAVLIGLLLLVWSADRFIEGSASTARYFGMPPLLIGMVIVGFGTSAPEMIVSALAAFQGSSGLALGNAFGSNICNIALMAHDARAQDLVFIKITAPSEPVKELSISPAKAEIAKGTIVYWVNAAPADVAVVFAEGKRCKDVTAIPFRFVPDFQSCYLTDYLSQYDTSRLQFSEAGTFEYEVKTEDGVKTGGKIVVK